MVRESLPTTMHMYTTHVHVHVQVHAHAHAQHVHVHVQNLEASAEIWHVMCGTDARTTMHQPNRPGARLKDLQSTGYAALRVSATVP